MNGLLFLLTMNTLSEESHSIILSLAFSPTHFLLPLKIVQSTVREEADPQDLWLQHPPELA